MIIEDIENVSKFIYEKYKNTIVCVSCKKNIFYYFYNHRWNKKEQHGDLLLKQKINNEVLDEYIKLLQDTKYTHHKGTLIKIINKLKSQSCFIYKKI